MTTVNTTMNQGDGSNTNQEDESEISSDTSVKTTTSVDDAEWNRIQALQGLALILLGTGNRFEEFVQEYDAFGELEEFPAYFASKSVSPFLLSLFTKVLPSLSSIFT